jgi:hypothetical protein
VIIVNIFINWLYTQKPLRNYEDWAEAAGLDPSQTEHSLIYQAMIKACAFGDRILAPAFEQLVHDGIVDFERWETHADAPDNATVICAFEYLPNNEKILDFIVDLRCGQWIPDDEDEEEKALEAELPHEFLLQCVKKLSAGQVKTTMNLCSYHQHTSPEDRKINYILSRLGGEVAKYMERVIKKLDEVKDIELVMKFCTGRFADKYRGRLPKGGVDDDPGSYRGRIEGFPDVVVSPGGNLSRRGDSDTHTLIRGVLR